MELLSWWCIISRAYFGNWCLVGALSDDWQAVLCWRERAGSLPAPPVSLGQSTSRIQRPIHPPDNLQSLDHIDGRFRPILTTFVADRYYSTSTRSPPFCPAAYGMAHLPLGQARCDGQKSLFYPNGRRIPTPKAVRWSRW